MMGWKRVEWRELEDLSVGEEFVKHKVRTGLQESVVYMKSMREEELDVSANVVTYCDDQWVL